MRSSLEKTGRPLSPHCVGNGAGRRRRRRSQPATASASSNKTPAATAVIQDCSDGMSDATHVYSATMTLKGTTYTGCAAEASAMMPVEEGGVAEDTTAAATAADGVITRFKANGFSPAWRAEVDGTTVKLDVPEHGRVDPGFTTLTATRSAYAKGVEFSGTDGKVEYTLNIRGEACERACPSLARCP